MPTLTTADEHYFNLLEMPNVPVGVLILKGENYKIEFINPVILNLWGRTKSQVINKYLYEALPELTGQGFEKLLNNVYTTGVPYFGNEVPVKLNRGGKNETVYFNFVYNPMRESNGIISGIFVTAVDATAQVTAKLNIDLERNRLYDLFEDAPAFMATLKGSNHVFEMANKAYYQLVGHRDIIGKPVLEALPEIKEQGFVEILNNVLKTSNPFIGNELKVSLQRSVDAPLEDRFVNFVYQPIKDSSGEISGVFAHGYDVTTHVNARKELSETNTTLQTIIKSSPLAIYVLDPKGSVVIWNKAAEELFGWTENEVKGKKLPIVPKDKKEEYQQLMKTLLNGKSFTKDVKRVRKDGVLLDLVVSANPLFTDGKLKSIIAIAVNISERKQLERRKDEFLGIASHELKTPVTSIKAYAQVLERIFRKRGDNDSAEFLAKMSAQVNKLTNLIGDLLDVTKIQAGKLQFDIEYFNFRELLEEVVEEVQRTTEKHKIMTEYAEIEPVYGDRERVGQVLTNLLTNAIKYSPHSDKIIVKLTSDKKNVNVCVQDFGVGIPKKNVDRVFEQFYRVSGPGKGTFPGLGLGLYISSEIIKRQGGRIWVESTEGKGSTFCFTLPIKKHAIYSQTDDLREELIKHE